MTNQEIRTIARFFTKFHVELECGYGSYPDHWHECDMVRDLLEDHGVRIVHDRKSRVPWVDLGEARFDEK